MQWSTDRILTTYAGRLPNPPEVMDRQYEKEAILRVKAQTHSIEAANVRYEHAWKVWQDVRLQEWHRRPRPPGLRSPGPHWQRQGVREMEV